jgi:CheY-like chemotaxis protein
MYDGLGLGLAIVKQLVDAHGGSIAVTSAGEGRGAVFTVRLPLARVGYHPRHVGSPGAAFDEVRDSLAGLSVLVVDDDEDTRQVMCTFLEAHQATVRTAGSAAAALDVLQREQVDVLLADVAMPGEDGYSLIRRLRAQGTAGSAQVPAAALTAFAREEDRVAALDAGFQMHLAKPIDAAALVSAVSTLGRSKK